MKTEIINTSALNESLEAVMKRLLDLLREILGTIHEEHIALAQDDNNKIKDVLKRREELFTAFDLHYKDFALFLQSMNGTLENNFSLTDGLESLQMHLEPEDVELLLLSDQLARVSQEMQTATQTLISFLEHKSAFGPHLRSYFTKIAPKPARIAVGLVEDDNRSDSFN